RLAARERPTSSFGNNRSLMTAHDPRGAATCPTLSVFKSGGPEVLVSEPVPIGKPGPGEARVRHTAVGVNFVDIYIPTGLYPAALPSGLGTEAAGVVEEVGPGVDHIKAGDRVAYAGGPLGAYSEVRVMPADRLVALPQGISDQQAAAM